MKIRITQGFVEGHGPALNPGYELTVPDVVGQNWIDLGRAVRVDDNPKKTAEQPSRLPQRIETPTARPQTPAKASKKR